MKSDYALFRRGVNGAWDPVRDIPLVFDTYYTDNCRVVRFVNEDSGQLFDATIKTAGTNDKLIPLKAKGKISDTKKYGGYNKVKIAYFALVKSKDEKGKAILSLEPIPVMATKLSDGVQRHIIEKSGLADPKIVIPKIRLSSLLIVNGSPVYIKSKTNKSIVIDNAAELYIDKEMTAYLKKVGSFNNKYNEAKKYKKTIKLDEKYDGITRDKNVKLYDIFTEKLGMKIYAGLSMVGQKKTLENLRNQFQEKSTEIQCVILCKILSFMKAGGQSLDLSDFNKANGSAYGSQLGVNTIPSKLKDHIKLVVQSPTGQYRQVIDFDKFLP